MKYETPRLRKLSSGSAQKNLLLDTMKNFNVLIPDKEEQQEILSKISPIDDLIKLNIEECDYIQNYINRLYNYWFIDYNFPNKKNKPYKNNNGKFEYNEMLKKDIPLGWKVEDLYNCSMYDLIKPGIEKFIGEKRYLATGDINGEDFSNGKIITFENREGRANMQPIVDSIWFAKMKNSIKHMTLPNDSKMITNKYILSTGFMGFACKKYSLSYLHSYISFSTFENIKNYFSHGATQQAINNEDLKKIYILIPPEEILQKFDQLIYNLIQKRFDLMIFNKKLEDERDVLLKYLMSKKK